MTPLRLLVMVAFALFVGGTVSANKNSARLDRQWRAKRESCEKDVCRNGRSAILLCDVIHAHAPITRMQAGR